MSENIRRRHLNKGQAAILYALAYPDPTPGKRTDLLQNEAGEVAINSRALSHARAIARWAPEYVEDILAGAQVFAKAFEEADRRREKAAVIVAGARAS